jgi:cytochrome c peroxidase
LIFFDKINGLHNDNSCAGCHTPAFGFGDSQSIAIGVDNSGIVGRGRKGPRNQRRAPMIVNTAFSRN